MPTVLGIPLIGFIQMVIGAVVVLFVLIKYLGRPKSKKDSSTCKQIEDFGTLDEELDKPYNLVVLDYNWNNRFDDLKKMPHKEKIEILVNACCTAACPRRGEHYRSIGEAQIKCWEFKKKFPNGQFKYPEFKCEQQKQPIQAQTPIFPLFFRRF